MSSTPAMKVLVTAPMPGSRTPSLPLAGGMRLSCLFMFVASPEIQHDAEIKKAAERGGQKEFINAVHQREQDEQIDEVALRERVREAREPGFKASARGL